MTQKIIELTKDNYPKYLQQMADLEEKITKKMKSDGIGDFYDKTGYDNALNYIMSGDGVVLVSLDDQNDVNGAVIVLNRPIAHINQRGQAFDKWIKEQYGSENKYKKALLDAYDLKLKAYRSAKTRLMYEDPNAQRFFAHIEEESDTAEGKELVKRVNSMMMEYAINNGKIDVYERFFWLTADDIAKEFDRNPKKSKNMKECELITDCLEGIDEAVSIENGIPDSRNTFIIDTCFTDNNSRNQGLSRILMFEGIKRQIERFFTNSDEDEMVLMSYAHGDSLSARHALNFLEMNRIANKGTMLNRKTYERRIKREEAEQYISNMQERLVALYGYNPNGIVIPNDRKIEILKNQVSYDSVETRKIRTFLFNRLMNRTRNEDTNGQLNSDDYYKNRIRRKMKSILSIQKRIIDLKEKGRDIGE